MNSDEKKELPLITREQFAKWSFERDLSIDLFDEEDDDDMFINPGEPKSWDNLKKIEKKEYLEEAKYYLKKKPSIGYPDDIVDRAEKENIRLPS